jgi:hypothetical protein
VLFSELISRSFDIKQFLYILDNLSKGDKYSHEPKSVYVDQIGLCAARSKAISICPGRNADATLTDLSPRNRLLFLFK